MPEAEDKIRQTVFHNDDIKLVLEYPADTQKFSSLGPDEFAGQVEIFSRILFNSIANKDRKEYRIIMNDETGLYEYFIPTK